MGRGNRGLKRTTYGRRSRRIHVRSEHQQEEKASRRQSQRESQRESPQSNPTVFSHSILSQTLSQCLPNERERESECQLALGGRSELRLTDKQHEAMLTASSHDVGSVSVLDLGHSSSSLSFLTSFKRKGILSFDCPFLGRQGTSAGSTVKSKCLGQEMYSSAGARRWKVPVVISLG